MKPTEILPISASLHLIGRPLAYYPKLAKLLGGAKIAIFLCQFMYWEGKQEDDGWIFKTGESLEEETGLSREEQQTARKKLKSLSILEEKLSGLPARMHYRFNWKKLDEIVTQAYGNTPNKFPGFPQTGLGESPKLDRGIPANIPIEQETTTETTAESTTENTSMSSNLFSTPLNGSAQSKQPQERKKKDKPEFSEGFLLFWDVYPAHRKGGKGHDWKIWQKKNLEKHEETIRWRVIYHRRIDPQWLKNDGEFIPLSTTFLNQDRWQTEVPGEQEYRADFDRQQTED